MQFTHRNGWMETAVVAESLAENPLVLARLLNLLFLQTADPDLAALDRARFFLLKQSADGAWYPVVAPTETPGALRISELLSVPRLRLRLTGWVISEWLEDGALRFVNFFTGEWSHSPTWDELRAEHPEDFVGDLPAPSAHDVLVLLGRLAHPLVALADLLNVPAEEFPKFFAAWQDFAGDPGMPTTVRHGRVVPAVSL